MAEEDKKNNIVELWPGKTVEVKRAYLVKDVDYVRDLTEARKNKDFGTIVDMTFALIGDDSLLDEVRQHITEEKGYFDIEALTAILEKISAVIPKAPSPAQKRW